MSERGPVFDAAQEAYDAAHADLVRRCDNPDKTVPASEYMAQLRAAEVKMLEAHQALMAAWSAPRIILGVPVDQLPEGWSTIAATTGPIMTVHTACDAESYAAAHNDGYEAAVTQGLADDPSLADDWFQEKLHAAKVQALREAADLVSDQGGRYWAEGKQRAMWLRKLADRWEAEA